MRVKTLSVIAWFLIKFNLLALPMYAVIITGWEYEPLRAAIGQISNWLLNDMGLATHAAGSAIQTAAGSIDVSWDSTGWKSLYAIIALALATPLGRATKVRFIAAAVPTIFVINIMRIVSSVYVAIAYGIQYFNLVHLFLWREGLITAIVLLWGVWLWKEKDNITKDQGIFRWIFAKQS